MPQLDGSLGSTPGLLVRAKPVGAQLALAFEARTAQRGALHGYRLYVPPARLQIVGARRSRAAQFSEQYTVQWPRLGRVTTALLPRGSPAGATPEEGSCARCWS